MSGVSQKPPRAVTDPGHDAVLRFRYELQQRFPVTAGRIARHLQAGDPADESRREFHSVSARTLSRRVLRAFSGETSGTSLRWAYLDAHIVLGVPGDARAKVLEECAELYQAAFPFAKDCTFTGPPRHGDETGVRLAGQVRRWLFAPTAQTASERELHQAMAWQMMMFPDDSLYNLCRRGYVSALATARGRAGRPWPRDALAFLDDCERLIDDVERRAGAAPRRPAYPLHRAYHQSAGRHLDSHQQMRHAVAALTATSDSTQPKSTQPDSTRPDAAQSDAAQPTQAGPAPSTGAGGGPGELRGAVPVRGACAAGG
ncbi:hypothetical protein UK82_14275 [Frankia sp. ACN1ag]|nr:hypothetical protein UK82_14275 [Frankia sp. ACN1ag]